MKTHSIPNPELTHVLTPAELTETRSYEVDLSGVFSGILGRANAFVPSTAGVILLRDAAAEIHDSTISDEAGPADPEFVVVTAFGVEAKDLVGRRVGIRQGLAGLVYRSGESLALHEPALEQIEEWRDLNPVLQVRSVIAVPLHLRDRVVGVLELLNQRHRGPLRTRNLELLKVFAQTISASISTAIEALRSKEMARRDDLTRLYNDRYLHHSLTQILEDAVAQDRDCGLVFFDLDHFKNVNDTHGHLCGSRVLREIGSLLRQILPGPAVAARYGGDEFVVILPDSTRQEVYWVAETIRRSIEDHVFLADTIENEPFPPEALRMSGITASVGLAMLHGDAMEGLEATDVWELKNEFLRRADTRMYMAKAGGRNRTVALDSAKAGEDAAGAILGVPKEGEKEES